MSSVEFLKKREAIVAGALVDSILNHGELSWPVSEFVLLEVGENLVCDGAVAVFAHGVVLQAGGGRIAYLYAA